MTAQQNYWQECIAIAAEECELTLTPDQLNCLAESARGGHEHYSMAFYSPSASDRLDEIEAEWKAKLKNLQAELDAYRDNAEAAVKRALKVHRDDQVSIEKNGQVLRHGGRTDRIQ